MELSARLLKLRREQLRILAYMFTGHAPVNRHLFIIHRATDPFCHRCGVDEETTEHLLLECPSYERLRLLILGDHADFERLFTPHGVTRVLAFVTAIGRF
mgnify:CR=1 FL=1